jgi:hypothetical protein
MRHISAFVMGLTFFLPIGIAAIGAGADAPKPIVYEVVSVRRSPECVACVEIYLKEKRDAPEEARWGMTINTADPAVKRALGIDALLTIGETTAKPKAPAKGSRDRPKEEPEVRRDCPCIEARGVCRCNGGSLSCGHPDCYRDNGNPQPAPAAKPARARKPRSESAEHCGQSGCFCGLRCNCGCDEGQECDCTDQIVPAGG